MTPTAAAVIRPTAARSRALPSTGWTPATCRTAEVRLYENLFADAEPDAGDKDFLECLNPHSLEVLTDCKVEAALADTQPSDRFQFMRLGYFCADSKDSTPDPSGVQPRPSA